MDKKPALKLALTAFFAATICIGSFIRIPVGFVPIVLQNALCVLSGILLGGFSGAAPTLLFLLAGLAGLPVYSGGTSGIGIWTGPTGGFLPGYLIGALAAGIIAGKPVLAEKTHKTASTLRITAATVAGMVILYIPGVLWFAHWALKTGNIPAEKTALAYAVSACVIPYIPGDIVKIAIAVPIALKIRPLIAIYTENEYKK